MTPPRKTKPATKKATKTATKKRSSSGTKATRATQLQVLAAAREHFGKSKQFKNQLITMDELDNTVPGYVSTQSLALDWITGNLGFPMSRVVDVSGDEGTGKSTLGDHAMAEVQRLDGHSYLWDPENARDNRYQEKIGIVRARAGQILSQTMEDGFELIYELLAWHLEHDPLRPGIILWDTPAGTPTRAEADPNKTDERMGPAKLIRGWLRKINQRLMKTRWIWMIINQTYRGQNISGQTYKAVYGGGGVPFYSSCRLQLSHPSRFWRSGTDKDNGMPPIGQTVWVKNIKNRCAMPWKSRQICIEFGHGIDNAWTVFDTLRGAGCIVSPPKSGWCSFDPDYNADLAARQPKSWQTGYLGLKDFCQQDPELWPMLVDVFKEIEGG